MRAIIIILAIPLIAHQCLAWYPFSFNTIENVIDNFPSELRNAQICQLLEQDNTANFCLSRGAKEAIMVRDYFTLQ